jgi:hypothetical protein
MRGHVWTRSLLTVVGVASLTMGASAAYAGNGFFTSQDITVTSGAPRSAGQLAGWQAPWDLTRHFAYVDRADGITILSMPAGGSTWTSVRPAGVRATNQLLSTYTYAWDKSAHVIYKAIDDHVHELWSSQADPAWHDEDLTVATGAPPALSAASGYEQGGYEHVIFAARTDDAIWELLFVPGVGWRASNLTQATHTTTSGLTVPEAVGRGDNFGQAIAYIGGDRYIHLLTWTDTTGWTDRPVSRWTGAPRPASTGALLGMFQSGGSFRLAITYTAEDPKAAYHYHTHEMYWTEVSGWRDVDVTQVTGAKPATAAGTEPIRNGGFFLETDASDHIFAYDADGAVAEFVRTRSDRWFSWKDTADHLAWKYFVGAFAAPDDRLEFSDTEYVAYVDRDQHVHVMDLTVPTS